jgi:hypothetical protein
LVCRADPEFDRSAQRHRNEQRQRASDGRHFDHRSSQGGGQLLLVFTFVIQRAHGAHRDKACDVPAERVAEIAGSAEMDTTENACVSNLGNGAGESGERTRARRDSEITVKEVLSPKVEARLKAAEPLIEA